MRGNLKNNLRKLWQSRLKDKTMLIQTFIKAPRQVGGIAPSSRYLVREMLNKVNWDSCGTVAELGAGTGVVTEGICKKLSPEGRLFVFEIDEKLRGMITAKHSGMTLHSNAAELPQTLDGFGLKKVDYIISSLPFAVFPAQLTATIMDGVMSCLKDGGKFVTFQYSHHMREELNRRFNNVNITFVLRNIPPAFVYECYNS